MTALRNDRFALHYPPTLRSRLRSAAILAGDLLGGPLPERDGVYFLYSHSVFEDELEGLEQVAAFVRENFDWISYSEAVERVREGRFDGRHACFSFDDGFANVERAAELFERLGVSCALFVNPAVVDRAGDAQAHREWLDRHCRERLLVEPVDFLDWDALERLKARGHEVGNHALTHRDLATLPEPEWREEIDAARERLVERLGSCEHFAWPFGRRENVNEAILRHAMATHRSVAAAIRGRHEEALDLSRSYLLRDLVLFAHGLRSARFFARRAPAAVADAGP